MSTLDHTLKPEATTVRRLEVITGTGKRRRFSEDDKARVVEETLAPGAVISEVARRHGLSPQQVFTWRRQAKQVAAAGTDTKLPVFVPAVVEAPLAEHASRPRRRRRAQQADRVAGMIEVAIDGVTVRIGRGADAKTVTAVLRALRAGA